MRFGRTQNDAMTSPIAPRSMPLNENHKIIHIIIDKHQTKISHYQFAIYYELYKLM